MTQPLFAWTSTQPNDELVQTALGSPTLAGKAPIGTTGSLPILIVPTIAALQATSAAVLGILVADAQATVQSNGSGWSYQPAGGATADGITVVAATNGPAGAQWWRTSTLIAAGAIAQTVWNVSNAGNDEASGLDAAHAIKTVAEIARRYGTTSPDFGTSGSTTIKYLDAPSLNDTILFTPRGGVGMFFDGSLAQTQIFNGALGGLVARNRATGQEWQATAWAGAAVGQVVVNSTHASTARVLAVGGGLVTLSQPVTSVTSVGGFPPAISNVDTWANGDTITAFALVSCHVVRVAWQITQFGSVAFPSIQFYRLNFDSTASLGPMYVGDGVGFFECGFNVPVVIDDLQQYGVELANCAPATAANNFAITAGIYPQSIVSIFGGACSNIRATGITCNNGFSARNGANNSLTACVVKDLLIPSGGAMNFAAGPGSTIGQAGGPGVWGLGTMNVLGGTRVRVVGTATANLQCSSILLDNIATAYCPTAAAGVMTLNGPRNLTAALLDTAVGGGGFTDNTAFGVSGFFATNAMGTSIQNISN